VGSTERAELGVLGDPINIAARLVARAAPGEVLLADSVYAGLATTVRADLLGRSAVRGRDGELDVYRVAVLAVGTS
jgi:class 3 adenylate cyclase